MAAWIRMGGLGLALWLLVTPARAEKLTLTEEDTDARSFQLTAKLTASGTLQTPGIDGKSLSLPLNVTGTVEYRERRLPGRGRDAQALRALRYYDAATADITVRDNKVSSVLRPQRRLLVAQGERDGVELFSSTGGLTYTETELLNVPGDNLAIRGLLPATPVEQGDRWTPETWVMQTLVGVDAMLKSELNCELTELGSDSATVKFTGKLEGAHVGATTEISVAGTFQYDLKEKHISRLEMTQTEKRAAGAVSPGVDVKASVVLTRKPLSGHGPLADAVLQAVPLNPPDGQLDLEFQTPWNVTFQHDRRWHLFKQTGQVAVLRLLEDGSLIAQFNVTKIPSATGIGHTPLEDFQRDIQTALGEKFEAVDDVKELPVGDDLYIARIQVAGIANKQKLKFIYYLVANPKGEQLVFVFSLDEKLQEQLGERDLNIVKSVKFLGTQSPTPAQE